MGAAVSTMVAGGRLGRNPSRGGLAGPVGMACAGWDRDGCAYGVAGGGVSRAGGGWVGSWTSAAVASGWPPVPGLLVGSRVTAAGEGSWSMGWLRPRLTTGTALVAVLWSPVGAPGSMTRLVGSPPWSGCRLVMARGCLVAAWARATGVRSPWPATGIGSGRPGSGLAEGTPARRSVSSSQAGDVELPAALACLAGGWGVAVATAATLAVGVGCLDDELVVTLRVAGESSCPRLGVVRGAPRGSWGSGMSGGAGGVSGVSARAAVVSRALSVGWSDAGLCGWGWGWAEAGGATAAGELAQGRLGR